MSQFQRMLQKASRVPGITAVMVYMTPELAMVMMEMNTHNRKISDGVVEKYVREQVNDEWYATAAGIGIDANGVLVDGQQRLQAVIKSGKTVPMLVVTGLPAASQEKMDRQRKRTMFDVVTLAGIQTNRAAVQVATFLSRMTMGSNRFSVPADSDIKAALKSHFASIHRAYKLAPSGGRWGKRGAAMYAAFALAIEIDESRATEFITKFHEPSGLTNDDPRWRLSRWSIAGESTGGGGRDSQNKEFKIVVGCINAFFSGRKINKVEEADSIIAPEPELVA